MDVIDQQRVRWVRGLTCEFAGVFEGVLAKKIPDYLALILEERFERGGAREPGGQANAHCGAAGTDAGGASGVQQGWRRSERHEGS